MIRVPGGRPTVSVIIPCYNLGAYVDEAVESVLAQSYQDVEILVIDDGSTEPATRSLLDGYHRPRTRVIRAEHGGLAAARNLGITAAAGRYLCALDADDRLAPAFFEKTVPPLDADPSIAFVSCWLRAFGDETWEWTPARCDLPALLWEDTILTAALVRRDVVVAAGGYDTRMPVQGHEDWDLWLTLVEQGHRGVILPEVLFHYRRRAGSMSTICWNGAGHLPLLRYQVDKHWPAYQAHVTDVLLHQDEETAALLRRNDELERYIASDLEPALTARQQELATLQARLAHPAPTSEPESEVPALAERVRELSAALGEARAEVSALHRSKSWRLTTPFRRAVDVWLRWRARR